MSPGDVILVAWGGGVELAEVISVSGVDVGVAHLGHARTEVHAEGMSLRVGVPLMTGNMALSPGLGHGVWRFDDPPVSKMIAFQPGTTVCVRALQKRVYGLMATCGRLCILVGSGVSQTGTTPIVFRALRLPTRRCECDGYFYVLCHSARVHQDFQ